MDNEFDFRPDFEFDEFDEFEDFDDTLEADVLMRTAVLKKNNMVALLCIKGADQGAAICRVDPREEHPSVQIYDDHTLLSKSAIPTKLDYTNDEVLDAVGESLDLPVERSLVCSVVPELND